MAETRKRILSAEEINQLTDEQLRKLLKEKGFSDEEIDRMTKADILRYLQSHELGPEGLKVLEDMRKKNIFETGLPLGTVESTQFHIQKLQYRKASDVVKALRAIAASILGGTTSSPIPGAKNITQSDLIITLDSLQVIEENNSIVLTGTASTLQKAKDLISQIDVPVKQVLIETLLLDTTLTNTLNFGVDSGFKLQRRNFALEGGLFGSGSTNVLAALAEVTGIPVPPPPPLPGSTIPFDLSPNAVIGTPNVIPGLNAPFGTTPPSPGFSTGTIGRKILFNGHGFLALAGLLNAVRSDSEVNIILNPKLTTEHNVPAELFVGSQVGIKGQSISNNNGNILTTNYEIRQTGVLLKITPLISDDDTITLIVEQSISQVSQAAINAQSTANSPPATVNETRTLTRVHLPSEHFVILSGLMREEQDINNTQIPCLGGLPLIGALFSQNSNVNNKHNLLLFLRPYIIENEIDIDDITKKQQEIWDEKSRHMNKQRGIFDDLKTILNLGYN